MHKMSDQRSDATSKAVFIKELNRLNLQIQNIERERLGQLFSKRNDFRQEFAALYDYEIKTTEERKTERVKVKQQLHKIKNMVSKFNRELKEVKPTPEFVQKLKIIIEEIEQAISQVKDQQRLRYEALMKEEFSVNAEIEALEKRMEAWSQVAEINSTPQFRPKPLSSARDVTKDLPPAVAAFEHFLAQTGGPRGGWDEYDHQTFLKFRLRYKEKPTFLSELVSALPTKCEEEINDHELWYQDYLDLNEKKKLAISQWKLEKEAEKNKEVDEIENIQAKEDEKERLRKEAKLKKIEKEKEARFSELNAWKVQKELEKAKQEEKALREALISAKDEEKKRQNQQELKMQVEEYRRQKQEEEEERQQIEELHREREMEENRILSDRNKSRIIQRNQQILNEKLSLKKSKVEAEKERQKRIERMKAGVEVEVKRDPTRLYRMTEGWKNRKEDDTPRTGTKTYQMPHRAVPTWRQGLH